MEDDDLLHREPQPLTDGDLVVTLAERLPGDEAKGWVPAYHFKLHIDGHPDPVGHVNLRIGWTEHVVQHAGHIGYEVDERWRGRRIAARSVRLILSFAKSLGIDELWVTCNPDNQASLGTLRILAAERVDEVEIPPGTAMYKRGERRKVRFRLVTG